MCYPSIHKYQHSSVNVKDVKSNGREQIYLSVGTLLVVVGLTLMVVVVVAVVMLTLTPMVV
jgi:CHASE3 domain sensor protein